MPDYANLNKEMVVVENPTDEDLTYGFDGKLYRFKSHSRAVAPIGLAKLWFGHWEITDPVDRLGELSRLQTKHGVEAYLGPNLVPAQKVRVFTLDGDPVTTVLDDPHAASTQPVVSAEDEVERLRAEVAAMREKMDSLHTKLGRSTILDDIPVDTGTKAGASATTKKNGNGSPKTVEAAPPDEELSDALGT